MQFRTIVTPTEDEWPETLLVQLERFQLDSSGFASKNQQTIEYSINDVVMPGGVSFIVWIVVCHVGTRPTAGHYYALSRDTNAVDSTWHRLNDHRKVEIKNATELITNKAYVFFLEKQNVDNPAEKLMSRVENNSKARTAEEVRLKAARNAETKAAEEANLKAVQDTAAKVAKETRRKAAAETEAKAAKSAKGEEDAKAALAVLKSKANVLAKRAKAEREAVARADAEDEALTREKAERQARIKSMQADRIKAAEEDARLAAAGADPDKAEADAKAQGRNLSESEQKMIRATRHVRSGVAHQTGTPTRPQIVRGSPTKPPIGSGKAAVSTFGQAKNTPASKSNPKLLFDKAWSTTHIDRRSSVEGSFM